MASGVTVITGLTARNAAGGASFIDTGSGTLTVANFAALPAAGANNNRLAWVASTTGSLWTKKYSGWYISNGSAWAPADFPDQENLTTANVLISSAGTINFAAGDVVVTHSANTLAFTGASSGYTFDAAVTVASLNITGGGAIASGTYTPTRSAEANTDANVTMTEAQYMRVGNTVTVSGRFTADPTLTATTTSFEMTLPVASNIGAVEDVAGTAFCGNIVSMGAEIIGVVANDTAKVQWKSSDVTSQIWSYIFCYQII